MKPLLYWTLDTGYMGLKKKDKNKFDSKETRIFAVKFSGRIFALKQHTELMVKGIKVFPEDGRQTW